jgi:UDP-2,3-diacylglucosamine pyrophosphatase LpxH
MPIFCVSDLHLCDRGYRDNFACNGREERFHRFLDYVEAEHGQLYVLGDLFDFWQTNVSRAIVAYLPLLDRLNLMSAVYVMGNHDGDFGHFIGRPSLMPGHPFFLREVRAFEQTIAGRRFAFLHGNEGDPYCRDDNPGTGAITAIISGLLEDRNNGPFDRRGNAIEDKFVGTLEGALTLWRHLTFQHGRMDEMLDGVEAYRKEKQCDVVVYGHTHEPGHIGDYHFNTGSWARTNDTFVRIEDNGDDAGAVSVWEWTAGNQPIPFVKVLR